MLFSKYSAICFPLSKMVMSIFTIRAIQPAIGVGTKIIPATSMQQLLMYIPFSITRLDHQQREFHETDQMGEQFETSCRIRCDRCHTKWFLSVIDKMVSR